MHTSPERPTVLNYEDTIVPLVPDVDDPSNINPVCLEVLKYQLRVEDHTPSYRIFSQINPDLQADSVYARNINVWEAHEERHAEQLSLVVRHFDPEFPDRFDDRKQQLQLHDRFGRYSRVVKALILSLNPQLATCVVGYAGYKNELMTGYSYAAVMELADHPLLCRTLPPIRRQEPQNAKVYEERIVTLLDGSPRLQKQTRTIVSRMNKIVGEDYRGQQEADFVIRALFGNRRMKGAVDKIDARLSDIPGMKGLQPLRDRVGAAMNRSQPDTFLRRIVANA